MNTINYRVGVQRSLLHAVEMEAFRLLSKDEVCSPSNCDLEASYRFSFIVDWI